MTGRAMGKNSKIEWTDHTLNLWWGCTKVSNNPLCDNCYAETFAKRVGNAIWGADKPRRAIKDIWVKLDKWQSEAEAEGTTAKVFTMSMGDIFERSMPLVDHTGESIDGTTGQLRETLFSRIDQGAYPNLIFQMLTKRPQNVRRMVPESWLDSWPENVWLGVSIGDTENMKRHSAAIYEIPATIKFLSCEPLLGPLDLDEYLGLVDWVIVGGESGRKARRMSPDWVSKVRDDCKYHGVPFFFKQWGEFDKDGVRVGKKSSGNLLDGRQWLEFPIHKLQRC